MLLRCPGAWKRLALRLVGCAGCFGLGFGAEVDLAWDANLEPDLAGYRVHYGPSSGNYTQTIDVGNTTSTTINGLTSGVPYFAAVTAYDTDNLGSAYSNEITFTLSGTPETTDSDNDGLSDHFEATYGQGQGLAPLDDLDEDGLTALAEFYLGLDPTVRNPATPFQSELVDVGGTEFQCVVYDYDPLADQFASSELERRTSLVDPGTVPALTIAGASSWEDPNVPANTLDGNLQTRWSAFGPGEFVSYELAEPTVLSSVDVAFHLGTQRTSTIGIEVSCDGINWTTALASAVSSGLTNNLQNFEIPDVFTRYVRLIGYGNSDSDWNSITGFGIQTSEAQWNSGETVLVSTVPSSTRPGCLTVTRRSIYPAKDQPMEFFRLRIDVVTP